MLKRRLEAKKNARLTKTVFVVDNASWHHNKELMDEVKSWGVSILFLPPSSSDLNPIGKYLYSYTIEKPLEQLTVEV